MNNQILEWLLRIGVAGEFFGHGLLAIQGKQQWVDWIAQVLNVDDGTAAAFLLLIGLADVAIAAIVLIHPIKPLLLWAAFWGFLTAIIRPIVGESVLDFIERSANWAAPLALFYFYQNRSSKK